MKILKIKIDGYRNVFNTIIELNGITALVALNNYGKSNVLNGIDFAVDFIKLSSKTKNRMMRHIGSVPINKMTQNNNFTFGVDYISNLEGAQVFVSYEFSFEWIKTKNDGCRLMSESLKIKESGNNKFSKLIDRTINKSCFKSSKTGRADTNIEVGFNDLIINKLSDNEVYYSNIVNEINNLNFDFNSYLDVSNMFKTITINDPEDEDIFELDKDEGLNICNIVYQLKEKHIDKYNLLINSFKSLVPSVETIEPVCTDFDANFANAIEKDQLPFKIPEKMYDIKIMEKYNNQITSMRMMSTGSKRIFVLLTSAILAEINKTSLITFEELENSIHPYLFQKLIIILTELVGDCKILISSHSPYLIQYLSLDKVYIGIPSSEGTANFKRVKKSMQKTISKNASEQETSIGDYIFDLLIDSYKDNCFLCSFMEG